MCRLGYIAVFSALIATALGVLPPPAKLEAAVEEDGALILITPVKGAAGYLVSIEICQFSDQICALLASIIEWP